MGASPWVKPAATQALEQPPLGLPELVLVQGLRRQGLPGPQAESSFPFPGGYQLWDCPFGFTGSLLPSRPAPEPCPPLTGVAFTVFVLFTEEAFTVEAGHLVPGFDVLKHLHAGCVPICRHKLGAGPLSALACPNTRALRVLPWDGQYPGALGSIQPPCPGPALITQSLTICCLWLPPLLQEDDLTPPWQCTVTTPSYTLALASAAKSHSP